MCVHVSTIQHTHMYIYICIYMCVLAFLNEYIYNIYNIYICIIHRCKKNNSYANQYLPMSNGHACVHPNANGGMCMFLQLLALHHPTVTLFYFSNIQLLCRIWLFVQLWRYVEYPVAQPYLMCYENVVPPSCRLWYLCRDHSIHPSYLLSKHN
jgi:hypothetical protein